MLCPCCQTRRVPTAPSGRPRKRVSVGSMEGKKKIVTGYADFVSRDDAWEGILSGTLGGLRYTIASHLFSCSLELVSQYNKT